MTYQDLLECYLNLMNHRIVTETQMTHLLHCLCVIHRAEKDTNFCEIVLYEFSTS